MQREWCSERNHERTDDSTKGLEFAGRGFDWKQLAVDGAQRAGIVVATYREIELLRRGYTGSLNCLLGHDAHDFNSRTILAGNAMAFVKPGLLLGNRRPLVYQQTHQRPFEL